MKIKLSKLLTLLLALLCLAVIVGCDTDDIDGGEVTGGELSELFTYELSSDGKYYILTGVKDKDITEIKIPKNYKNLPVAGIGKGAFNGCKSLKDIEMHSGIHKIDPDAFEGLDSIVFNEYDNGFYIGYEENPYLVLVKAKNTNITSCKIPKNTMFIYYFAFANCKKLETIEADMTRAGWERVIKGDKWDNNTGDYVVHCTDDSNVEDHTHMFNFYKFDNNATCTEYGTKTAKCQYCDATNTVIAEEMGKHRFGPYISDNNSTCTIGGTVTATCELCGETKTEESRSYPPLGHKYAEYIINSNATCTEYGTVSAVCERCGETTTEESHDYPPLGHNILFYDGQEPSCNQVGWHPYEACSRCEYSTYEEIDAYEHGSEIAIGVDSYSHWTACVYCDEKNDVENHTFEAMFNDYACVECGYICEEHEVGTAATCNEQAICAFCGVHFGDLKNHTRVYYSAVAATCTENGATSGSECSECGTVFTAQSVIPALGHSWSNYYSDNNATCTEDGTQTSTCNRKGCGEKRVLIVTDSKLGHSFTQYISNEDATYIQDGTKTALCGRYNCEATDTIVDAGSAWLAFVPNNFYDNTYSVIVANKTLTEIVIPSEYNGLPVTEIRGSFSDCTELKKITIPSTIKRILFNSFYGCTSLKEVHISDMAAWCNIEYRDAMSNPFCCAKELYLNGSLVTDIVIPEGVTKISNYAFYGMSSMTSIKMPSTLTNIGYQAFGECTGLTDVEISNGITHIEHNAFSGCESIDYNEYDNAYYLGNKTNPYIALIKVKDNTITSCEVNDKTGLIVEGAFSGCSNLETISLPFVGDCIKTSNDTYQYPFGYIFGSSWYEGSVIVEQSYYGSSTSSTTSSKYYIPTSLRTVSISGGSILYGAFYGCSRLTNIVICEGVTSIGSKVFGYCKGLTSITIPDSVTSIGDSAFSGCTGLTSITIPDNVTNIGYSAFFGCTGLTDVYISDIAAWCNIYFGDYSSNPLCYAKNLYLNGSLITELVIPDSITTISNYAFCNQSSITKVEIPISVTNIGYSAFSGCTGLTDVYISDIAAWCNIDFGNSSSNPLVHAHNLYLNGSLITELVIPDDVTGIPEYAFNHQSSITKVEIPTSVTSIGDYAFSDCTKLTDVYISDIAAWCNIDFGNSSSNPLVHAHNLYLNGSLITELVIPDDVTGIPEYAFNHQSSITKVEIPDSVTRIEDCAFSGCTGLTSITIPNSVTRIEDCAFSGCRGLTSITIPDSVTRIGDYAFSGCRGLTSITIPDSVTRIGDYAFSGCTGLEDVYISDIAAWCNIYFGDYSSNPLYYAKNLYLNGSLITELVIPDGVTKISNHAFNSFDGFTSITIPDSVTSIGSNVFGYCTEIASITIPDTLTSIGDSAFSGCTGLEDVYISDIAAWCNIYFGDDDSNPLCYANNLYLNGSLITELVIPDGVTRISNYAFNGFDGFTSITIPDSVTSIGDYAFYKCTGLTSINIPGNVTSIGDSAFYGCTGLTSITIPDSVTSIGDSAFYKCTGLTSINIPGNVTSIGDSAFYGCTGLTSITIPDSVTNIEDCAFSGCTALTSISVVSGNTVYHSQGNCLIETATGMLISGCSNSTIPTDGSIRSIGDSAFYGCTGLTSITIPDSVTSIGRSAFYDCTGLEDVYISDIAAWCNIDFSNDNSNPLWYAENLYLNGSLITELVIPDGVTKISNYAFNGFDGFTSITIPNSVTSIGDYAFYGCTGLTSVMFENTSGWWVSTRSTDTSGTSVDVTDAAKNVTYLRSTYYSYYWKRG